MARRGPKATRYRVKRIFYMGAVYSFPRRENYEMWYRACKGKKCIVDPVSLGAKELFVPRVINSLDDL